MNEVLPLYAPGRTNRSGTAIARLGLVLLKLIALIQHRRHGGILPPNYFMVAKNLLVIITWQEEEHQKEPHLVVAS